ncbi:MAG: tetratricopeptide repeat protein [Pseudomonadota bacterium]
MARTRLSVLLLAFAVTASGCSWIGLGKSKEFDRKAPKLSELLAELPPLELPEEQVEPPSAEDALAAYEQVYGVLPQADENFAIGRRLADLKMARGEARDIDGEAAPYDDAVALYEELLLASERTASNRDQILYQLARAHDVQGHSDDTRQYLDQLIEEHPDSRYATEAHFRRAELAFSARDYDRAAADFGVVVAEGQASPLWLNANYMRGWSLFKLSELEAGLLSFYAVVDALVGAGAATKVSDVTELPATDRELLADSLRVTTLALGYLDGAATLAAQMAELGRPSWQFLAYERLAQELESDERFLDSVATWQVFVDENPLDVRAPNAHKGMIDTLLAADFPSEVLPRKRAFIDRYGVRSEFWQVHNPPANLATTADSYLPTLRSYLDELTALAHAQAQAVPRSSAKRADAFLAVADGYEQIIETFPEDPELAEQLFLLGEVYTEAERQESAVDTYQRLLADFPDHPRATEAGYAAVLGLTQLLASAEDDAAAKRWAQRKIDAQVEFALLFPEDPRAPAVQVDAANALFEAKRYTQAIQLAEAAEETWPALGAELAATNLLVLGHGHFELADFAVSEAAFERFLALPADVTRDRDAVAEKRLAAVFKQGEAAEAAGEVELAVGHYLRIKAIDPSASLAAQGHFDAVAVLESSGDLVAAADLLTAFRNEFPTSELNQDLELRLAGMHEQSERLDLAAEEYVRVSRANPDPEVARQALFRAGEIYDELGDGPALERTWLEYVERYPTPYEPALEVIEQLDQLAVARRDESAHRRWLQDKIRVFDRMGADATERAADLAVRAEFELAEEPRDAFRSIRLTRPLPKSLKRKQQALAQAVAAYERVAAYKVPEFASASAFEIAELYRVLARSIMESERPAGLSALELEQYDLLLEEQAYPFEEQAIELHEINMRRSWQGLYDPWVQRSFEALGALMPARFDKQELVAGYVESIY